LHTVQDLQKNINENRVFFENQLKFMAQPQYFYLQGAGLSIGNPQGNTIGPESSISARRDVQTLKIGLKLRQKGKGQKMLLV